MLPIAMIGTFNLWQNKTLVSEGQAMSTVKGDSTTNNTGENTNGSLKSNSSSATNNSEINSSTGSNNANIRAVTMYSFSISIEGVNDNVTCINTYKSYVYVVGDFRCRALNLHSSTDNIIPDKNIIESLKEFVSF